VRASDAERERVVDALRAHAAEGRLDTAELEDRVEAALAARTDDELAALGSDLPRPPRRRTRNDEVKAYLGVMALLVFVWAATGADYFWPIWPMLGWGVPLALCTRAAALRSRRHELARVRPGAA